MAISEKQVREIAELARLELTDEQAERFAGQLGAVIEYMDRLKELDVEGVQFHPESILTQHGHDMLKTFLEGRS